MAQLKEEDELKPFGGFISPQKTAAGGGISLKSTVGSGKTEKHGYNIFLDTEYIFKKFNETISVNGTDQIFEVSKKVEPISGDEVKLALARRLYKNGVGLKDLIRMELILDPVEIKEQDDFEEIKDFHLHSAVRNIILKYS